MIAERSIRPMFLLCIFSLITSIVAPVASVHAQEANPVIASLNSFNEAVLHGTAKTPPREMQLADA
jgi:hypothetical protein